MLIKDYLQPWIKSGRNVGEGFIHETDVYADDPTNLTLHHKPLVSCTGERAWYFLTKLQSTRRGAKYWKRTVPNGGGWWNGEGKPKPVGDPLDILRRVGYYQSFTFMKDAGGQRTRTGWLMKEFSLQPEKDQDDSSSRSLVLCKVYRSPRHRDEHADRDSPRAGRKREAEYGESCKRTDDSSSQATADKTKSDREGSCAATVAAPKADDKIPFTATAEAPGRKEKYSADAPESQPKAMDDACSVAASAGLEPPLKKRKMDGRSEVECPECGCTLVLLATVKSKSETAILQVDP